MSEQTPQILVVDDDPEIRRLLARYVEGQSFGVLLASSCSELRKRLATDPIDLVVLDVMLPDGSGLDLCRKIREFDQATPIVFYSAAAYEIDRAEAIKSGAQAYLIKPSHPSELCSLVTSLIESHRRPRHRAIV